MSFQKCEYVVAIGSTANLNLARRSGPPFPEASLHVEVIDIRPCIIERLDHLSAEPRIVRLVAAQQFQGKGPLLGRACQQDSNGIRDRQPHGFKNSCGTVPDVCINPGLDQSIRCHANSFHRQCNTLALQIPVALELLGTASHKETLAKGSLHPTMPTLFRFLVTLGVIAGLVYGAMFALVTFVEPRKGEMIVRVPLDNLNK